MIFTSDSCVALALRMPRSFLATVILVCAFLYSCGAGQAQEIRLVVTDIVGLEELQTEYGAFQKVLSEVSGIALRFFPVTNRTAAVESLRPGARRQKACREVKGCGREPLARTYHRDSYGKGHPEIQRPEIHYASNCSMSIRRTTP
jgi:hypothetical protein